MSDTAMISGNASFSGKPHEKSTAAIATGRSEGSAIGQAIMVAMVAGSILWTLCAYLASFILH